ELARKNSHVFVAGRDKERCETAVDKIKGETGNNNVEYLPLDLQSLRSVKNAAEIFLNRKLPLHILINNAAIMTTPFSLTVEGIMDQFGINHIGHFYFTKLLLPTIESSAPSRIVNVSSKAHLRTPDCGIDFENLNNPEAHGPVSRYAQSKLANILFSLELNKRLAGKEVYVNSVHPGSINTELYRSVDKVWGVWTKPIVGLAKLLLFISPEDGALTQLYCATSPEIVEKNLRAKYFVPYAQLEEPSAQAKDEELARKLWEFSENFINERLKKIEEEDKAK
ncbi:18521_t:CDS:2, partial [Acaulospora morrowiae]